MLRRCRPMGGVLQENSSGYEKPRRWETAAGARMATLRPAWCLPSVCLTRTCATYVWDSLGYWDITLGVLNRLCLPPSESPPSGHPPQLPQPGQRAREEGPRSARGQPTGDSSAKMGSVGRRGAAEGSGGAWGKAVEEYCGKCARAKPCAMSATVEEGPEARAEEGPLDG